MKTQKRHSETFPSKYIEKTEAKMYVNEEDVGSQDSDSTCEDKKEKEKCTNFFMET